MPESSSIVKTDVYNFCAGFLRLGFEKGRSGEAVRPYIYIYIYMNFKFPGQCILNPQEGGRLDAKRRYVILAEALFGQLVMSVQCCVEAPAAAAVPQRSIAQA